MIKKVLKFIAFPITFWLPRYYFALKYLDIKPNHVVLDIGCGTGIFAARLAKQNNRVYAVDISRTNVQNPSIKFKLGSATNIPFPDEFFDKIVCLDVLEFVSNDNKAFIEFARALKPKGELVLTVPSKHSESEKLFFEQRLLRKIVPDCLRNAWLNMTQEQKKKEWDKRLRNYDVSDIKNRSYPQLKIIRWQYALKRFSRFAIDITYGIKGFAILKPWLLPLARILDAIFCKKQPGFILVVKLKKCGE